MKIRTRIFLVFVIVLGGGFFFLVRWIADDLRPRYLESLEEPLVDTANLLAELFVPILLDPEPQIEQLQQVFQQVYARRFHARIYALEKQRVDMRVYVTDARGTVLFDSAGLAQGQDYSRWNDVHLSLQGRYGARATHEDPENPQQSVLYIAAPIQVGDRLLGVVSVGKPAHNVDRFIAMARQNLMTAGWSAALLAAVLGLVLYLWVSLPLERLTRYARGIKAGERAALPKLGNNEIGLMGEALEEMRTALAGKDYAQRYVQTLTHELKSPLAAIRGAAELLDEDMPLAERRRFIKNIRSETERIQSLVERMLELAAVEQRQALRQLSAIEAESLLAEVIESLLPQARLRQIRIELQSKGAVYLLGERFLLRQALLNLLRNALDFSPPESLIRVSLDVAERNAIITIEDQGPGVPEYALEKIFERFYSLPRPQGGAKSTGLGLSFVQEVAALHGGSVKLVNRTQGGVQAIFQLATTPTPAPQMPV